MTRHELIEVAQACAAQFGQRSAANVFLRVLAVCFRSDTERQAATLSAYWSAGPEWVDAHLCEGDVHCAAHPANAADAARAFARLGRLLPLPIDPSSQLIKTMLLCLDSQEAPAKHSARLRPN